MFREDFSINVANQYYGLVEQQTSLDNQRTNIEVSIFQKAKADALYTIGKTTQIEVLRARRQELARPQRPDPRRAELRGLARPLQDLPGPAHFVADRNRARRAALHRGRLRPRRGRGGRLANRLDYLTRTDQLDDARRGLDLAEQGMRSDLSLTAGYGLAGNAETSFTSQGAEEGSWDVGLSWDVPLDRVAESHALRRAQISYKQSLRTFQEFEHNLEIDIRTAFRQLDRIRQSIGIQEELINDQQRNLKKAQIENEAGRVSNREVQDAQQALVQAQNSKISEQVAYEIARLELLRDLGLLFVDEQGVWMEHEATTKESEE